MSQQHQQGNERGPAGPLPEVPYAGALLRVGAMAALHPLDYAKTLIQVAIGIAYIWSEKIDIGECCWQLTLVLFSSKVRIS